MTLYFCKECKDNLESDAYYGKTRNICRDCLNEKTKCQYCNKIHCKKWLTKNKREKNAQKKKFDCWTFFWKLSGDEKTRKTVLIEIFLLKPDLLNKILMNFLLKKKMQK